MHNIRTAGQIRPVKALNLARKAQNPVYIACFFHENIPVYVKTYQRAQKSELCTPALS
jgi:hypothetical protein